VALAVAIVVLVLMIAADVLLWLRRAGVVKLP